MTKVSYTRKKTSLTERTLLQMVINKPLATRFYELSALVVLKRSNIVNQLYFNKKRKVIFL